MAKRKRSRREIMLGGAGLLAAGGALALALDRITDPAPTVRSVARPTATPLAAPPPAATEPTAGFVMEEPLPGGVHLPAPPPRTIADLVAPTEDKPRRIEDLLGKVAPPSAAPSPIDPAPIAPPPVAPPATVAGTPVWLRNAEPLAPVTGRPAIALVIDDLGIDRPRTERALALDSGVTLAFMAYADGLARWSEAARAGRHEVLLHVPMEPTSATIDPGPEALLTTLPPPENMRRLRAGLDRIAGHIGINNHMGSRFTENAAALRPILAEVRSRHLLFLDSRTSPRTEGARLAAGLGLVNAERNVFLDNELTGAGIARQLAALKDVATKRGTAIGIGHPHEITLAVLADWLPRAKADGFAIVPLTTVVRRQGAV